MDATPREHCLRLDREKVARYRRRHPDRIKASAKRSRRDRLKDYNKLKVNGCAICGYDKSMKALEFHHANPEDKKIRISNYLFRSKGYITQEFLDELNKCVLLCRNCHMEVEAKEAI